MGAEIKARPGAGEAVGGAASSSAPGASLAACGHSPQLSWDVGHGLEGVAGLGSLAMSRSARPSSSPSPPQDHHPTAPHHLLQHEKLR